MIDRFETDPRRGFSTSAEFLGMVADNAKASRVSDVKDQRGRHLAAMNPDGAMVQGTFLMPRGLVATVGSDEQGLYSNRHGGFLPGAQFIANALGRDVADPTFGRTQAFSAKERAATILARSDADHTTSASGGIVFSRKPETVAGQVSRAAFEQISLRATAQMGITFGSEQLVSSTEFRVVMDPLWRNEFGATMLNEKIRGGGGDQYLGVLNSPAKITVSKETNQVADTIAHANVSKMKARCWGYEQAVWLANPNTGPQIDALSVGLGSSALLQFNALEGASCTLAGRPLFFTEFCNTLGDEGDLILCNWSQYLEAIYSPLKTEESVHVRFVEHERCFRIWEENAGAPWWRVAVTPRYGSDTLSPIVTLAARA